MNFRITHVITGLLAIALIGSAQTATNNTLTSLFEQKEALQVQLAAMPPESQQAAALRTEYAIARDNWNVAVNQALGLHVANPTLEPQGAAQSAAPTIAASSGDGLPSNFVGFGAGLQSASNPKVSGWADVCRRNPDVTIAGMTLPSYLCLATDYSGSAASPRADLHTVFVRNKSGSLIAGTKMGAGASITSNAGGGTNVGGAFDVGGFGALKLGTFAGINGLVLTGSITWLKQDVSTAVSAGPPIAILHALGSHAAVRFGFGKTW
jgi:hypothetical protein